MLVLAAFAKDESGVAFSEYALIAAAFAVMMISVMKAMQSQAGTQLSTTQSSLTNFGLYPP